jgi:hypothetical protein
MPDTAAWGSVTKYVMPRNPMIPEMSLHEIVSSEPLMRNANGQVVGDPVPVYRGNSPKLSITSMYSPGTMYLFKLGWLYVTQGPSSPSEWMFGAAKEAALMTAPGIGELAGPFSELVTEITRKLMEEVHTSRAEGHKGALKGKTNDVASELQRRGALFLPGVNLVEIEYFLDPPKLFSKKEWHRCVMTYEKRDGKRTSYTVGWRGPIGKLNVGATMNDMMAARRDGEFGQLMTLVVSEHVDLDAIAKSKLEEYRKRFGDALGEHWAEFEADLNATCEAELARVGLTRQRAASIALERLEPLIPSYETVPVLSEAVRELRGLAS